MAIVAMYQAVSSKAFNTLFGIMSEWVISGMKDDPELLARMICDIYQDKLRRY